MKLKVKILCSFLSMILLLLGLTTFSTLSASASSDYVSTKYYGYNSNQSITVNYSAGNSGKDWIGVYKRDTIPSSKPSDAALAWKYVSGSGSITFNPYDFQTSTYSPQKGNYLEPGDYKIVLAKNDGYTVTAQSNIEIYGGNPDYSFQVISDLHVRSDGSTSVNLERALKDINRFDPTEKNNSKDFMIVNGDSVDDIRAYENLKSTFISTNNFLKKEYSQKVPYVFFNLGNHELYDIVGEIYTDYNSKYKKFYDYTNAINNNTTGKSKYNDTRSNNKPYYDTTINGNHFIFLASENEESSIDADLSNTQLEWLDNKLWHIANDEEDQPVFVFCHQGLPQTVAGTYPLPDRYNGWSGVKQSDALKFILNKYPNVFFFSSHSHWELSAPKTMEQESAATYGNGIGATLFNTASVTNLWANDNKYMDGSQGYQVDVYDDKVVVRGRDFLNGKWLPEARFCVNLQPKYNSLHQIYQK